MSVDFYKIKAIIWDLDETFWQGTLSAHNQPVKKVLSNIELVKKLAMRGIPSSICSKNDWEPVKEKLEEFNVLNYFVFCSVNWEPKGERIKDIISNMSLRAQNVLFIDDNPSNRAEALFVMPDLMTASPDILLELDKMSDKIGKDDRNLTRLNQYKILEKKSYEAGNFSSNLDFLKDSSIKICIKHDIENNAERVYELIQRSNQLNFTKKRISLEEVLSLASDPETECGYVKVSDKYGVYGIVGFYAVKNNIFEHFLFSCRVMGMGIEQFVFAYLNYPSLTVVGPVSSTITKNEAMPSYITMVDEIEKDDLHSASNNDSKECSLLVKGSCDLQVMIAYIEGAGVNESLELNFVDSEGNQADFYNHTVNILNTLELDRNILLNLSDRYPFLSKEAYSTSIMNVPYDCIFLSMMMDATLAVYRHKRHNYLLAYGVYNKPLTNQECWDAYIEQKVMTCRNKITIEQLEMFSQEFEQIEYTPDMVVKNFRRIIQKKWSIHPDTKFIIPLLPELPYDESKMKNKNNFAGKELAHQAINGLMKDEFQDEKNIFLLDVNRFIKKQSDYFDSINHYSKLVYYQMANEARDYLNSTFGRGGVRSKPFVVAIFDNFKRILYKNIALRHHGK